MSNGTYKSLADLYRLSQGMDLANISDEDRAVVLDADDWLGTEFQGAQYLIGFRIVWRTTRYTT